MYNRPAAASLIITGGRKAFSTISDFLQQLVDGNPPNGIEGVGPGDESF